MSPNRNQRGITLIELLVVVTIIALFAALVGPKIIGRAGAARTTAAKQQINDLMTALGAYKLDTGRYPTTDQGLQALRVKPSGVDRWDGPYLPKDVPPDPWGKPYLYKFPGDHGDEPDICTLGADGKEGGEKEDSDVCSWKN